MKKWFYLLIVWSTPVFANNSAGILGQGEGNTITAARIRNGNFTMNDIPILIASVIESVLALAGAICVVALIYHAVRMQLASGITGDSSGVDNAKKGMKGALIGFVLAMSAWFLMARLISLIASGTNP